MTHQTDFDERDLQGALRTPYAGQRARKQALAGRHANAHLAALLLGALLCCARPAWAADAPAPSPTTKSAESPRQAPELALWLDAGESGLEAEPVRAAVERELGRRVVLGEAASAPLSVVVEGDSRLNVTFTTASGERLARSVDLPNDPARRLEIVALLAGNLARDEARELLSALAPPRAPATPEKAAPPPAPTPKSEPKPPSTAIPESEVVLRSRQPGLNLALYHPIAWQPGSERRVFALAVGAAYSRVGAIEGMGFSLGVLRVEHQTDGFAFALGASSLGGHMYGLHSGVLYAEGHGRARGLALSGLWLHQHALAEGALISGLVNLAGDVDGLQVSGALATQARLRGAAVSGVLSLGRGDTQGLIVTGGAAVTRNTQGLIAAGGAVVTRDTQGLVVSGALNVTGALEGAAVTSLANWTGDLDGLAVSVLNVSRDVRGVQLGVVNVASELDGVQLGLFNFAKNGRTELEAFASTAMPLNAAVKFRTGSTYTELGLGFPLQNREYAGIVGFGLHFPVARWAFEPGARFVTTIDPHANADTPKRMDVFYQARASYRVLPYFAPFVSVGVRHGVYREGEGELTPEAALGFSLF